MADGGFFGGLSSGLTSARQQNIQQQQVNQQGTYQQGSLALQAQQEKNAQQRALFGQADKQVSNLMSSVGNIVSSLKLQGKDNATISKAVQPLVQAAKRLRQSSGGDPSVIDAQLAGTLAQPSVSDILSGSGVTAQPRAGTTAQPRGIRNNNPGNIEAGTFAASQPGYAGSDGRFAKFDTPQAGMDAQGSLLERYSQQGINTINGIVTKWAPASDGNDPAAYSAFVAKKLGIDPNQPINLSDPIVRKVVSNAMGQFENGQKSAAPGAAGGTQPAPGGSQPAPTASPQGMPQPQGQPQGQPQDNIAQIGKIATVLQMPNVNPALKTVLQAKLKQMVNPSYDMKLIKDPVTGQSNVVRVDKTSGAMLNPDGTPYHQAGWPQVDPNVHGQQYIADLSKTDQSLGNAVKAVGDYTLDPSKITGFGDPATKIHILGMIKQYNPDYDEKLYDRYHAGNQAWARGGPSSPASQTKSYSVLVSHLNLLRQMTIALASKDPQTINRLKNAVASEFGAALPNSIQAVGDIVTDELAKAVLGGAGALGDREKIAKRVAANSNTAGQMLDLLDKYTKLSSGQLEGLKQQFEAQTGRKDFNTFLTPDAQKLFEDKQSAATQQSGKPGASQGQVIKDWTDYH
jgi:hypothetical protein